MLRRTLPAPRTPNWAEDPPRMLSGIYSVDWDAAAATATLTATAAAASPHPASASVPSRQQLAPLVRPSPSAPAALYPRVHGRAAGKALAAVLRQERARAGGGGGGGGGSACGALKTVAGATRRAESAQPHAAAPAAASEWQPPSPAESGVLDVSRSGLTDRSAIALAAVLASNPAVTSVDLSYNPVTDVSGPALVRAVRASGSVVAVATHETFLSPRTQAALQRLAARNAARRREGAARTVRRARRGSAERRVAAAEEALVVLVLGEKRARRTVDAAQAEEAAALRQRHAAGAAAARRAEAGRTRRAARARGRVALVEEEEAERRLWLGFEGHSFATLAAAHHAASKVVVEARETEGRRTLRAEMAAHRADARSRERLRLQGEGEVRVAFEAASFVERRAVVEEWEAGHGACKEAEQAAHAAAARTLQERLEREAAEVRRRKQEELRLEKERQIRMEREARRIMDCQVSQDKEARAELTRRTAIEREEAHARGLVAQVRKVDAAVAVARQQLMTCERLRAEAYATPPNVQLRQKDGAFTRHAVGSPLCATPVGGLSLHADLDVSRVAQLCMGVQPAVEQTPQERKRKKAREELGLNDDWGDIVRCVVDARKYLRATVLGAREEQVACADKWAEVLNPSKCDDPAKATTFEYDASKLVFAEMLTKPARATKLTMKSGRLSVVCAPPPQEVQGIRVMGPAADVEADSLALNPNALSAEDLRYIDVEPRETRVVPPRAAAAAPPEDPPEPRVTTPPAPPSKKDKKEAKKAKKEAKKQEKSKKQKKGKKKSKKEEEDEARVAAAAAAAVAAAAAAEGPAQEEVTHKIVVHLKEGLSLEDVARVCNAVQYSSGADHHAAAYERILEYQLELDFPTVSPESLAQGQLTPEPFTDTMRIKAETKLSIAVVPSLWTTPHPILPVEYHEGAPADRCTLVDDEFKVGYAPFVKKLKPHGFLFSKSTNISFDGFTLQVRGVSGWGEEDMVVLRTAGDDDMHLDASLRGKGVRVMQDGLLLGEIVGGQLLRAKDAELYLPDEPLPAWQLAQVGGLPGVSVRQDAAGVSRIERVFTNGFELRLSGPRATPQNLLKLLHKLRFFNPSKNPEEGARVVEFSLQLNGMKSSFEVPVVFLAKDDPASMTLATKRVYYRHSSPMVPEHHRMHVRQVYCPVFEDVKVEDVDTELFSGGSFVVTLHNAQRGDELVLYPSCAQNVTVDASDAPSPVDRVTHVRHNGVTMGVVEGGVVFDDDKQMGMVKKLGLTKQPTDDVQTLTFKFQGRVPLASIQHLLRAVCFSNSQYSAPDATRRVSISLKVGPSADNRGDDDSSAAGGPPSEEGSSGSDGDDSCDGSSDGEEFTELTDEVEVRLAAPLFGFQGAHNWRFEYREGSGSVRIAPFEMTPDKEAFLEGERGNYSNGCVWVEIVDGACEDDVLNLRTGNGADDLRVELRKGVKPVMPTTLADTTRSKIVAVQADTKTLLKQALLPQAASPPPAAGAGGGGGAGEAAGDDREGDDKAPDAATPSATDEASNPPSRPSSPPQAAGEGEGAAEAPAPAPVLSLKERLRNKAQEAAADSKKKKDAMLEQTRAGLHQMLKTGCVDERTRLPTSQSDVYLGKLKGKLGVLSLTRQALFVKLATKGIGRKEVREVIRNITYANTNPDASILTKVLRVTVRAAGFAPTQIIIQVDVQSVDDVTEIIVDNARPKYRQYNSAAFRIGAWPLARQGQIRLEDPDTTHLDGGTVSLEIQGGAVKGDTLHLMTTKQQRLARVHHPNPAGAPPYIAEQSDGKLFLQKDGAGRVEVGVVESLKSAIPGVNNLRFTLATHDPPALTLEMISYVMSCVAFKTVESAQRITVGQRAYVWKVKDTENPVEGKVRVLIDVAKALIAPHGDKPVSRVVVPGSDTAVLDKVAVTIGDGGPNTKKDALLTSGSLQIFIVDEQAAADVPPGTLAVHPPLVHKDGSFYINTDYVGKAVVRDTSVKVDFGWASKASAKNVGALLTSIHYKAPGAGGAVKIQYQCEDKTSECLFQANITIKGNAT